MDRDEFMELVYETFADEPDNVLANGIIEAADAYVEYEKAQTVERLRGVVEITVPITDYDGGYIDGIETGISIVSTMQPTIQPEPQWIPVSERLPEVGQTIIAQCRANIIKTLKLDSDGDWYQDAEHCYMSGFVVAWMPLPEAYKPNK